MGRKGNLLECGGLTPLLKARSCHRLLTTIQFLFQPPEGSPRRARCGARGRIRSRTNRAALRTICHMVLPFLGHQDGRQARKRDIVVVLRREPGVDAPRQACPPGSPPFGLSASQVPLCRRRSSKYPPQLPKLRHDLLHLCVRNRHRHLPLRQRDAGVAGAYDGLLGSSVGRSSATRWGDLIVVQQSGSLPA